MNRAALFWDVYFGLSSDPRFMILTGLIVLIESEVPEDAGCTGVLGGSSWAYGDGGGGDRDGFYGVFRAMTHAMDVGGAVRAVVDVDAGMAEMFGH